MSPVEIGLSILVLALFVAIVYILSHLPQVSAALTRIEAGAKAEALRVEAAARQDWETLKADSEADLKRLEDAIGLSGKGPAPGAQQMPTVRFVQVPTSPAPAPVAAP